MNSRVDDLREKAYAGIASVSALAAMPDIIPGKKFLMGIGYGHYKGQNAIAFGFKGIVSDNVSVTAGVGLSNGDAAASAGAGFSW